MKLLKIAAVSYAIKTLLIGAAWLAIPDLPQRARAAAQHTWARMFSGSGPDAASPRGNVDPAARPVDQAAPTTR